MKLSIKYTIIIFKVQYFNKKNYVFQLFKILFNDTYLHLFTKNIILCMKNLFPISIYQNNNIL